MCVILGAGNYARASATCFFLSIALTAAAFHYSKAKTVNPNLTKNLTHKYLLYHCVLILEHRRNTMLHLI